MIDLTGFAPRDAKVIKENEASTIYELLTLGISQKAADRLNEMGYGKETTLGAATPEMNAGAATLPHKGEGANTVSLESQSNVVQPSSVKEVSKSKVQVSSPKEYKAQKVALNQGSKYVYNRRTGGKILMSASAANRLITKQPHIYSIA